MTKEDSKHHEPTERKSKIPLIFFAFFSVVIAVNVSYIYISNKTWRGVFTENAYQKGLQYNDTIEESERQKHLGWKLESTYERVGNDSSNAKIKFLLQDRYFRAINDAQFFINFKRPTQEGIDFVVDAKFIDKLYVFDVHFPLKGQWDAEITIKRNGESLTKKQRYIIE